MTMPTTPNSDGDTSAEGRRSENTRPRTARWVIANAIIQAGRLIVDCVRLALDLS